MEIGHCYEVNARAILFNPAYKDDFVLVHGVVTGTGSYVKGMQYGHAWLEFIHEPVVVDIEGDFAVPAEIFYRVGNVGHHVKMTRGEVRRKILETDHFGPWDETICIVEEALLLGGTA